jgi:hypothetical protein
MNPLLLILLLSFLGSRCAPKKELNGSAVVAYDSANAVLPYHLDSPDTTFYLSEELREISGLSLSPSPSKLSALQDEIGQLYLLHKNSGKADPPFVFKQDGGDFEGLEWKGDTAYAVRSKGTIYEIIHPGSEGELVLKYETVYQKIPMTSRVCACHTTGNNSGSPVKDLRKVFLPATCWHLI